MKELLTIMSDLLNVLNPQKDLDKHCDKVIKAKVSQKLRESQIAEITKAKIIYGYFNLAIIILTLIFGITWIIYYLIF